MPRSMEHRVRKIKKFLPHALAACANFVSEATLRRTFPKNAICDPGIGEGYSTTSNSRHFMAMFLVRKHHIFMHALAGPRYRNTGCSDARYFAAFPYATAGLEVTPPQADELWNDRRDTRKTFSF